MQFGPNGPFPSQVLTRVFLEGIYEIVKFIGIMGRLIDEFTIFFKGRLADTNGCMPLTTTKLIRGLSEVWKSLIRPMNMNNLSYK